MEAKILKKINNIICIFIFFFIVLSVGLQIQEIIKNSFFSYLIDLIIIIECFWFFGELNKMHKKEIDNIIFLSNTINEFNYENLKNIKKIYILNTEKIDVLLKDINNTSLTFNLSSLPQTQQELIEFDSSILINEKLTKVNTRR